MPSGNGRAFSLYWLDTTTAMGLKINDLGAIELLGMEFGIVILPEEQRELDERYGVTGMP